MRERRVEKFDRTHPYKKGAANRFRKAGGIHGGLKFISAAQGTGLHAAYHNFQNLKLQNVTVTQTLQNQRLITIIKA